MTYYTLMMLAMCSAPLQVRLHPVKSTVLMLLEYLTLWQITETYDNENYKNSTVTYSTLVRAFWTI